MECLGLPSMPLKKGRITIMSKKDIKIKFVCMGGENENGFHFKDNNNIIINILKKHFNVIFSDTPDYLFYSNYGYTSAIFKYNCVRIYWQGEYVTPDFNVCDYALSQEHMDFEDRHFRLLPYTWLLPGEIINQAISKTIFSLDDLQSKDKFCAFVHANSIAPERNRMKELLSQYKVVSSGGKYANNIGYYVKDKRKFFSECKFALVFENTFGYDSDRLIDAFASKTIPIYWGNPRIADEFNTKAFINVHEYSSFDEVVERIKEIDNNDELYLSIMKEPIFNTDFSLDKYYKELESFIINIFSQPLEKAYRRNRTYWGYIAERVAYSGAKAWSIRVFLAFLLWIPFKFLPFKKVYKRIRNKVLFYGKY